MRTRIAVVAAMAAAFAACSLTTNLDGLSGGSLADAAPPVSSGGGADGSNAEGGGDASSTGDAGDGSVVDPCLGAVFCDRFERDTPDGTWGSVYTDNGGTVTIDPTTSTSGTRSLAIHVPATGNPHAQLSSTDFPDVAHARVAFSMKCGAPNRSSSLMRIQLGANNRASVFDLFMFDGRFAVDENVFGMPSGTYADYSVPSGFLVNTWHRWSLELDATASPAVGIVTLDGVERVRTNLVNSFARGSLSVLMGVFFAPDGPAQDMRYDDVSITILP